MRNRSVLLAVLFLFGSCRSESTTTRRDDPPAIANDPPPPIERDPVYIVNGIDEIDGSAQRNRSTYAVNVAMRAVYDLCSKYFAFREGSTVKGNYVFPDEGDREQMVNVSVDLARPEKAGGDTLWYEVDLDLAGKPLRVKPQKRISADMCELDPSAPTVIVR